MCRNESNVMPHDSAFDGANRERNRQRDMQTERGSFTLRVEREALNICPRHG